MARRMINYLHISPSIVSYKMTNHSRVNLMISKHKQKSRICSIKMDLKLIMKTLVLKKMKIKIK